MSKRQEFNDLEKSLKSKFINLKENQVILNELDFDEGNLTRAGYASLKMQTDYIAINEELEIKIPKAYYEGFKDQLSYIATKELIRIKSDMKDVNFKALIFLIIGILVLSIPTIIPALKVDIVSEIFLIFSWVFVWAAVEKKFFKMYDLKNRRLNILHIISAKIKTF